MTWITIPEAEGLRFCVHCNFAGRLLKESKPCNYHTHKTMNYRAVPDGLCSLRVEDRERMIGDYGTDRWGKLKIKKGKILEKQRIKHKEVARG